MNRAYVTTAPAAGSSGHAPSQEQTFGFGLHLGLKVAAAVA